MFGRIGLSASVVGDRKGDTGLDSPPVHARTTARGTTKSPELWIVAVGSHGYSSPVGRVGCGAGAVAPVGRVGCTASAVALRFLFPPLRRYGGEKAMALGGLSRANPLALLL